MSPNRYKVLSVVTVAIGLSILAGYASVHLLGPTSGSLDQPQSEYNVTCYKWVENGTAQVMCPDTIYAPDSVVNITVKECDGYVFKIDESRPCGDAS